MRLIASLVYCLLALAGCHERNGTTSITRATSDGRDVLFSKTQVTDAETNVHCLVSSSGQCHYLIYEEQCPAATTAANAGSGPAPTCTRKTLDSFALLPGQVRALHGLPVAAHTCVGRDAPAAECHG
ncbi:hypothetical protein LN475_20825 [Xanthomonas vesicatoria]|uniref:Uncharacterized protein n=1 Tax=Xanthomonas vesicatoria ATCC 35937 TaxID=925775 RepID=F0B7U5_9XANT|nr:hypothetical protein [Xanthomonas vesicatoria]EGD11631.1 hypothetical protein XVE_0139 [Xanthomonas vesicatoria ATCC 35937]KTF31563.1 hypothetical protein LMG920_15830 [Xanthomonas vesicatoria]MCC8599057.1 hypothetical protein [Xanthomonas vesicatoria]MCC8603953.1 hypothetical protein [Xanthomonas vesicatoria]MCC8628457.1 hypothetical protein [Xanthomonas vesicatoria]